MRSTRELFSSIKDTSIRFYWTSPPRTECRNYQTDLVRPNVRSAASHSHSPSYYTYVYIQDSSSTRYVLAGTDPWNAQEVQSGSTTARSKFFRDLQPFSAYALFLYAEDKRGKHNEVRKTLATVSQFVTLCYYLLQAVYLKLESRTLPGIPDPPRELGETAASLSGEGATRQMEWLPPYPPKGLLE